MTIEELDTLERLLKKANDEGRLYIYDQDENHVCFGGTWYRNNGLNIEASWADIEKD